MTAARHHYTCRGQHLPDLGYFFFPLMENGCDAESFICPHLQWPTQYFDAGKIKKNEENITVYAVHFKKRTV